MVLHKFTRVNEIWRLGFQQYGNQQNDIHFNMLLSIGIVIFLTVSIVMLSIAIKLMELSVIILDVVMPDVVAPEKLPKWTKAKK